MQITLNQEEIEDAVRAYMGTQIALRDNQQITMDFTNGRGPNGLSATIDIRTSTNQPAKKAAVYRGPAAVTPPADAESADDPAETSAETPPASTPRKIDFGGKKVAPKEEPKQPEPEPEPEPAAAETETVEAPAEETPQEAADATLGAPETEPEPAPTEEPAAEAPAAPKPIFSFGKKQA